MKFSEPEFVIDKAYERTLLNKRETFRRVTGTKKSLFTTMVTTHGVKANTHRDAVVDVSLDMSALFG